MQTDHELRRHVLVLHSVCYHNSHMYMQHMSWGQACLEVYLAVEVMRSARPHSVAQSSGIWCQCYLSFATGCVELRLCHSDAAGACGAGVDSVFITGGIHAKDIAGADGKVDDQRMLNLMTQHGGRPTYTMPRLQV